MPKADTNSFYKMNDFSLNNCHSSKETDSGHTLGCRSPCSQDPEFTNQAIVGSSTRHIYPKGQRQLQRVGPLVQAEASMPSSLANKTLGSSGPLEFPQTYTKA